MALVLTPTVFVDLMRLCLLWEWEQAKDIEKRSHNAERRIYATQRGWTTVDKIVRILHGLKIVSTKQRSLLYQDLRLQQLVLRNSEVIMPGKLAGSLQTSEKDFVLQADVATEFNRKKMLRNMRFYITAHGAAVTQPLLEQYASVLSKERYFAEVERQDAVRPSSTAGRAAVAHAYSRKVAEET